MRRPTAALIVLAILALVAGCGDDEGAQNGADDADTKQAVSAAGTAAEEAPEATKPDRKPKPKGIGIKLADSQFGDIVFDENDQAIYLFDKETTDASECYGDCAAEWPPVLTKGEPQATDGVLQGRLGTTKRDDGTTQVTYNGHPLYYYAHEEPGEVKCHNIPGFGGIWLVLDAAGDPVPPS